MAEDRVREIIKHLPYVCPCDIFVTFFKQGCSGGFHPTTESNLRTALGVEICKLGIIARICNPLPDLCSEMGICSDVM